MCYKSSVDCDMEIKYICNLNKLVPHGKSTKLLLCITVYKVTQTNKII